MPDAVKERLGQGVVGAISPEDFIARMSKPRVASLFTAWKTIA